MEISVTEPEYGIIQISLSGRFDAEGAGEVKSQFMSVTDKNPHLVVVEMSKVHFLASTGIRLLIALAKSMKKAGGALSLAAVPQQVEYPLVLSGVDTLIPLYKTVEKAKSALM